MADGDSAAHRGPRRSAADYGRGPSYELVVAYDGSDFAGWQVQPNDRTVQQVLEESLEALAGRFIRVQGSGRTDSGVHARGQVVSFDGELPFPETTILRALNARLPLDVRVLRVQHHQRGFHALRHVAGKRYRYTIQDGRIGDVFQRRYSWRTPVDLDDAAMSAAAQLLIGEQDFASFQATGADRKSTVRTVTEAVIQRRQGPPVGLLTFDIAANGFLYNMVRIIVGTLVEVGKGKHPPAWVSQALAARRRDAAGPTAPPEGLCLMEVFLADAVNNAESDD